MQDCFRNFERFRHLRYFTFPVQSQPLLESLNLLKVISLDFLEIIEPAKYHLFSSEAYPHWVARQSYLFYFVLFSFKPYCEVVRELEARHHLEHPLVVEAGHQDPLSVVSEGVVLSNDLANLFKLDS